MTLTRRLLAFVLAIALLLGPVSPALAQDNAAVAQNTTDGSSVFQLAFDIRRTMQPVVEETNVAIAYSSCSSCRTVAIAIQIVLVMGDVTSATPQNVAVAINENCTACETFAAAYQFVLSTGGPVRFTREARHELRAIKRLLRRLGRGDIPLAELDARLKEIKARIKRVLETGLEPVPPDEIANHGHGGGGSGDGLDANQDVDSEVTPAPGSETRTPSPTPAAGTSPAPTATATPTDTSTPTPSPTATATPSPESTP
jgi:putative peptide zinc metalloprotease protein